MADPVKAVLDVVASVHPDMTVRKEAKERNAGANPVVPYATARLTFADTLSSTPLEVTTDELEDVEGEEVATNYKDWRLYRLEGVVRIDFFCDEAITRAMQVQAALRRQSIRNILAAADVVISGPVGVLAVKGLHREQRAQLDIKVRWWHRDDGTTAVIETVLTPITAEA